MQRSPSSEANKFSGSQEIPHIFMELEGSLPHSQVQNYIYYLHYYPSLKYWLPQMCYVPLHGWSRNQNKHSVQLFLFHLMTAVKTEHQCGRHGN
jgi:hypothetical protein